MLALYHVQAQAFPGLAEKSFCEVLIRNLRRGSVRGVYCEDQLAGVIIFSPPLKRISFLVVHPAFQRRGIGRTLMKTALSCLGGCAELFTYAPEDPTMPGAAYRLYQSLGFADAGYVPGYKCAILCMRKTDKN